MISNAFSDDNRGGAAITAATVRFVRDALPGEEVSCIAVNASALRADGFRHLRAVDPDVEIVRPPFEASKSGLGLFLRSLLALAWPNGRLVPRQLIRVRGAKLLVSKGGHVFVNRSGVRDVLRLWSTAFPVLYAARCGTPSVTSPTSIGPFENWYSRMFNRWLLRRFKIVLARDALSGRQAIDLGVDPRRLHVLPDSVFSFDVGDQHLAQDRVPMLNLEPTRYAVIVIRMLGDARQRAEQTSIWAEIAKGLLERPGVAQVAVVAQVSGASGRDVESAIQVVAAASDERVVLMDADLSPVELVDLYASAAVTVAARLHAAIFAALSGNPAVAISMEGRKTEGIYDSLGLPAWMVVDKDGLSPGAVLSAVARVGMERDSLGRSTRQRVAEMREDLTVVPEMYRCVAEGRLITLGKA